MSTVLDNKQRPFSADIARITKVRLQSSNCPTILKHEVNNPLDTFVNANMSEKQLILDRPRTASNATKMKFSFLQNMRPLGSPVSGASVRPMSGAVNSSINFEFLNNIGKTPRGKFQDKSKIKPLKKLNIDQFHSVLYKVKQQKEVLEKEINRMEQWHKDFKENDIYNTPQSAIIESIMRQNAKSNPDGSVSKYLQTEKEKDDVMRATKRMTQRPVSSYASLGVRSPVSIHSAKSVKDFFGPEDNGIEVIEEIISTKNPYYNQYSATKKKITEKVNRYVDNLENYNTLMHSSKELAKSQEGLREHKEPFGQTGAVEEPGKSISEIVESGEDSESSPSHAHRHGQRPQTSQFSGAKNRPFSAKMVVNTAFAPKDFANGLTGQVFSPHTMPEKQASSFTMKILFYIAAFCLLSQAWGVDRELDSTLLVTRAGLTVVPGDGPVQFKCGTEWSVTFTDNGQTATLRTQTGHWDLIGLTADVAVAAVGQGGPLVSGIAGSVGVSQDNLADVTSRTLALATTLAKNIGSPTFDAALVAAVATANDVLDDNGIQATDFNDDIMTAITLLGPSGGVIDASDTTVQDVHDNASKTIGTILNALASSGAMATVPSVAAASAAAAGGALPAGAAAAAAAGGDAAALAALAAAGGNAAALAAAATAGGN